MKAEDELWPLGKVCDRKVWPRLTAVSQIKTNSRFAEREQTCVCYVCQVCGTERSVQAIPTLIMLGVP